MSIVRKLTNKAPVPLVSKSAASGGGGAGAPSVGLLDRMGTVGTLFAIVNRTSTSTAAVEWDLYRVPKEGQQAPGETREVITKHPALDLWRMPNPFMTTMDLVEIGQQHLDLTGECVLVITRQGGIPLELWPVRPDRITPVPHPTDFLSGYIYKSPDGEKVPLKSEDVIHIKMPNPSDMYRGLGPVQALLTDLDSAKYSAEWNRNFFRNSAEPGGIIQVDRRLDDDEFNELRMRWNEQHRGVANAHRVAILEAGEWVDRKMTQRDMQFAELREVSRDVIMEAFSISRATMGITDGVNYAAAKAAKDQFAELLTTPRLRRWQQALNYRLLPMFEPKRAPGAPVVRTVEFDFVDPVGNDPEQENAERLSKAQAAQIYIESGFTATSVQEALGLPEMIYGTEGDDPDRDLLVQLVTGAPTLAPLILPMLGFDLPKQDPPPMAPGQAPPGQAPGQAPPKPPPAKAILAADEKPDLSQHQAAYLHALDDLLAKWQRITADQRSGLAKQIAAAINDGHLAKLADLAVDSSLAAEQLHEALARLHNLSAQQAAQEALEQGAVVPVAPANAAQLEAIAATTAALLATGQAVNAGREALRRHDGQKTGEQIGREVVEWLGEQSDQAVRVSLGGALTGTQNRARIDTWAQGPIGSFYADEQLDNNTCANCKAINGRFLCNTDDLGVINKLYTPLGGYVDCLGGPRCRGTVTGVWRPKHIDDYPQEQA